MSKIPATIGILTHNSAGGLGRCLASVKEFSEIIIADGGSTDATLRIAGEHGARILQQSNPGRPITDFALERNRLLTAATEPWFFYLDSDEIMSPELVTFIREVAGAENPYDAYRVRYLKTNADASKIYRTYREYYQIRLVKTSVGARFIKPVHERIELPPSARVGQSEAPWYVPLDAGDMDLGAFARKVWHRTGLEAAARPPKGVVGALNAILLTPLVNTAKSLYKMVAVRVRWGADGIPTHYELLRILAHWMSALQHLRQFLAPRRHA